MTKEEIQEAKMISQEAVTDVMRSPVQTDEVEAAVLLLPKALDALEEAHREIVRLEEMSLAGTDVLRCPDCKRIAEDNVNCEHCGAKLRPWFAVNAVALGESTT